jgi:Mce-associated membrane protein
MAVDAGGADEDLGGSSVDETLSAADDIEDVPEPNESTDSMESPRSGARLAVAVSLAALIALGGVAGWLGYGAYQSHRSQEQSRLFIAVARQGALNLTTIDYTRAEADVQRILDSSTGTFYDDFDKRSRPFIEVVKQAQAKSDGTITDAGIESERGDEARVLVAVNVNTTTAAAPSAAPRAWRMRISVQKVGAVAKVSNVEFVP